MNTFIIVSILVSYVSCSEAAITIGSTTPVEVKVKDLHQGVSVHQSGQPNHTEAQIAPTEQVVTSNIPVKTMMPPSLPPHSTQNEPANVVTEIPLKTQENQIQVNSDKPIPVSEPGSADMSVDSPDTRNKPILQTLLLTGQHAKEHFLIRELKSMEKEEIESIKRLLN